ncbi:MAG: hypothetical protein ACLGGX_07150 [Bdellovibrionia bacterium]
MESYSSLHQICVQVFEAVSKTTTIFILPLFMMRIVFSNILGEGTKVFGILKGTIIYFCLVAAFPLIIEVLFSIPESYLPKYNSLAALTNDAPEWSSSSIIPFAVDRILEVLLAGLYWIAYYLHIFFMIVMCSMAPIVFLSSTLLGLGLGLEIFLGLLIVGSSWPIIWYGFDQVHTHLVTAQTDEFGAKCLELLLTLFKGLSPVAFASIAIKSPPGRAITSAANASIASGKWAAMKIAPAPMRNISNFLNNSKVSNFERGRSKSSYKNSPSNNPTSDSNRLAKAKFQQSSERKPKSPPPTPNQKGDVKNENPRPRDIQA